MYRGTPFLRSCIEMSDLRVVFRGVAREFRVVKGSREKRNKSAGPPRLKLINKLGKLNL